MTNLKPGDRVRIRKPEDVLKWPGWPEEMDPYDGSVFKIDKFIDYPVFGRIVKGPGSWEYSTNWLEKIPTTTRHRWTVEEEIRLWEHWIDWGGKHGSVSRYADGVCWPGFTPGAIRAKLYELIRINDALGES
jgi:hypothetical protein